MKRLAWLALALAVGCGKDEPATGGGGGAKKEPTPVEAYEEFRAAVARGDQAAMWGFISNKSKKWLEENEDMKTNLGLLRSLPDEKLVEVTKTAGTTPAELKKMSDMDMARTLMVAEMLKNKEGLKSQRIEGAEVKGDRADIVYLEKRKDGTEKKETVVLIREDGTWRMDGEETKKLEK